MTGWFEAASEYWRTYAFIAGLALVVALTASRGAQKRRRRREAELGLDWRYYGGQPGWGRRRLGWLAAALILVALQGEFLALVAAVMFALPIVWRVVVVGASPCIVFVGERRAARQIRAQRALQQDQARWLRREMGIPGSVVMRDVMSVATRGSGWSRVPGAGGRRWDWGETLAAARDSSAQVDSPERAERADEAGLLLVKGEIEATRQLVDPGEVAEVRVEAQGIQAPVRSRGRHAAPDDDEADGPKAVETVGTDVVSVMGHDVIIVDDDDVDDVGEPAVEVGRATAGQRVHVDKVLAKWSPDSAFSWLTVPAPGVSSRRQVALLCVAAAAVIVGTWLGAEWGGGGYGFLGFVESLWVSFVIVSFLWPRFARRDFVGPTFEQSHQVAILLAEFFQELRKDGRTVEAYEAAKSFDEHLVANPDLDGGCWAPEFDRLRGSNQLRPIGQSLGRPLSARWYEWPDVVRSRLWGKGARRVPIVR